MSRRNRARREQNRQLAAQWASPPVGGGKARRAMVAESQALVATAEADPVIARIREWQADDTEVMDAIAAGKPAQVARLTAQHWRQRSTANDGLGTWDQPQWGLRIIHSVARELDDQIWAQTSVSRRDLTFPSWAEVRDAQWLLYPARAGVIVVAAQDKHVDQREVAHVWCCLTRDAVPDFTRGMGSI